MRYASVLLTTLLAASACGQTQTTLILENRPPRVALLAPLPDYGRVPADIDLVIEALATDLDDLAVDLSASLFIDDVLLDTSVPDASGIVLFDWHTPTTLGPVDIRMVVTDESQTRGEHVESYWVQ